MRNKKLSKLTGAICLILILTAALLVAACAKPAPAPAPAPSPTPAPAPAPTPPTKPEPVVLKAVVFLPPQHMYISDFFKVICDRVTEQSQGELTVEYLGGPEVVPPFELPKAVLSGVVDIGFVPTTFYPDLVPGGTMIPLSEITLEEERAPGGVRDSIWRPLYEENGFYFLSGAVPSPVGTYSAFYTNIKVTTPYDLVGQKMGPGTLLQTGMKALGIVPVRIPFVEQYSALERGVVDGWFNTVVGFTPTHLQEVLKYMVDHPFMRDNCSTIVNLDAWNGLSKAQQDLLKEVVCEVEDEWLASIPGRMEEERGIMQAAGMEFIKFSPADAKWMIKTVCDAEWERQMELTPELASKVRYMLSR